MTYLLSNRQRKELMVRGRRLDLAIPSPLHKVPDLVEWAKAVLPTDVHQYVRSAERQAIVVTPRIDGTHETLTDVLGAIVVADGSPRRFTAQVIAVVVELSPDNARHSPIDLQWPIDVVIDGRRLLGDKQQ